MSVRGRYAANYNRVRESPDIVGSNPTTPIMITTLRKMLKFEMESVGCKEEIECIKFPNHVNSLEKYFPTGKLSYEEGTKYLDIDFSNDFCSGIKFPHVIVYTKNWIFWTEIDHDDWFQMNSMERNP